MPLRTRPAVPLRSPARFGNGVTAQITRVSFGKVTDTGPGIIADAPVVTFTFALRNATAKSISLDTVQVDATYGAKMTPAVPANLSTSMGFSGTLAPSKSASATYAFAIPIAAQHSIAVTVWYAQAVPTVLMTGSAR